MTVNRNHLEICEAAEEIARSAGAILRDANSKPRHIEFKGKVDLVTQADREAEAAILSALRTRFPDHQIVAEESDNGSPDSRDPAVPTWYIDPLDGTTNFAHGFPVFAVSLAVRFDRKLQVGVVYDPIRDECFRAIRGQGAFLNGQPLHVSDTDRLDRALLGTGFPYNRHDAEDNNTAAFAAFLRRAQGVRRAGAAALDCCYVAAGRLDAFWEKDIKAWDVAAGVLVTLEAGGRVSPYDGDDDHLNIDALENIVVTNGRLHDQMIGVLGEVYINASP